MKTCKECRYFIENVFNEDGKCEKRGEQKSPEFEICSEAKPKLTQEELYVLEFSKKEMISKTEIEKYTGLKKQVFKELIENACITGKGVANLKYCCVQKDEFKRKYPNIFD